MIAGSAVLDITPASPCHLGGYGSRDHPHESVHDPLSARALYVSNGTDEVVLVSADILWYREEVLGPFHEQLEQALNIPAEHAMLCGTHTHSAPITNGPNANAEYLHFLKAQTLAAVAIAKSRAEAVSFTIGRGESHIGVNRRERKPDGEVILGENPDGPIDREIVLTTLTGESGRCIADICSFATHGTVMGGDNFAISGDWCGLAASALESESGGAFVYMNGGAANVNPIGRTRPSTFEVADRLAGAFVADIGTTREAAQAVDQDATLGGAFKQLELPRKQRDVEEGMGRTRRVRIHGIRIGPLRVVGYPGEVFSETSMAVKAAFPGEAVAVNSYTSGGAFGYVPVREAYDTGGYEVRVSPYAEEAESVLRNGFIDLARSLG